MSKEKFVVWSNLDLDLDDWRADLEDEYPGLNDDELIEKMTEINDSYASGLYSFGAQPHSMWNNFPLIHDACGRLQKVVIENKDFEKLIKQYDRPEAFFYCDPPYYNTEDYYEDVGFTRADHERLANALLSINGFFLLSYNDCPEIRELYSKPGITIEGTTRLSNIAQRYEGGKQYAELIISNYDTMARLNACKQLTLFDIVDEKEMSRTTNNKLNRRKYETEPDVFELEEMREREERYWSLDEDDPEEWYEEAFDCVMNLFDEILDAEDDTEVDECIVNARLA